MSVARLHNHDHDHLHEHAHHHPAPTQEDAQAGHHGHSHDRHHHSHGAGERHPAARPAFSLLRLSALQRLAIALPLAGLIWAAALAVIGAGN
ncbi:hypothetical protein MWN33_09245 [Starkeya koreensis]|uniref:Uncharacterized protein n=1 Tax=Ancylobacter koreensis TaxID=266121 RepID=A0ABT0DLQ2_9HYPH|nr:hypothetical protein [Ancylobacter koreensis]MCK0208215.1 hypothetical protein [Ancylobacter koreensis]